jgi:hypothetical protein
MPGRLGVVALELVKPGVNNKPVRHVVGQVLAHAGLEGRGRRAGTPALLRLPVRRRGHARHALQQTILQTWRFFNFGLLVGDHDRYYAHPARCLFRGDHGRKTERAGSYMPPLEMMTNGKFRHLPVLEGDRVVGLISIGDVVKWRVQEYENEQEALQQYIKTA